MTGSPYSRTCDFCDGLGMVLRQVLLMVPVYVYDEHGEVIDMYEDQDVDVETFTCEACGGTGYEVG